MPTTTTEPVREGARDEGALIRRVLPLPAIIRATLDATGLSFEALSGLGRSPHSLAANRVIVHLARAHGHYSYLEIGQACGKNGASGTIKSMRQYGLCADKPWGRLAQETLAELAGRVAGAAELAARAPAPPPLPAPRLPDADKLALEAACECFRLFVVLEDATALDALCEVLHARTARVDPDWKRPDVMGKAPSAAVVAMMEGVG